VPGNPELPQVRYAGNGLQTGARAILVCVELGRIAWLVTTVSCLIAAVIVLIDGYQGYAAVAFAVAISAAINLF
jgi:hypothetical protein